MHRLARSPRPGTRHPVRAARPPLGYAGGCLACLPLVQRVPGLYSRGLSITR